MSPTANSVQQVETPPGSDMSQMHRRRQQQMADQAAGQADAERAAVHAGAGAAAESTSAAEAAEQASAAAGSALIGQEIVVASTALVPVTGPGSATRNERYQEIQTPTARRDEQFASPLALPSPVPNGIEGSTSRQEEIVSSRQDGSSIRPAGPVGPPVSFGPTSTTTSPQMPLFTPEQIQTFVNLERQSPMLYPARLRAEASHGFVPGSGPPSMGAGDSLQGIGPLALRQPNFDQQALEARELQHREMMMQMQAQMDQVMSQMGLQLRASQAENQRLRMEIHRMFFKEDSRYHTPEESKKGEDGTRVQQERSQGVPSGDERRMAILRAQEEMIRNMSQVREDGAVAQQAGEDGAVARQACEDGATAQQDQEDGAAAQQDQEDGAEAQQESEEGSSDQQESSEESSQEENPSRNGPQGQGRPRRGSKSQETVNVMLQLMKGMQQMQKQIMKDKTKQRKGSQEPTGEEPLRFNIELAKLPEWNLESSPVDFSDWLLLVEAQLSDLSSTSAQWWETLITEAKQWYMAHLRMSPLEKLRHPVKASLKLMDKRWLRVAKRAGNLLLQALPEAQREEVIATKDLSPLAIITKMMVTYQPGSHQEKAMILNSLESPAEAGGVGEAIVSLRKWLRWKKRAADIDVKLPDPSVLLRGLDRIVNKVLISNHNLLFRVNLTRSQLMVDAVPTMEGVEQLAECLLAECDQLSYAKKKEKNGSTQGPQPKLKKFEEGGAAQLSEEKRPKGRLREEYETKKSPCRFFLTDQGCKRGRNCPYGHVPDQEKRCWGCGAKDHFSNACPRSEEGKTAKIAKAGAKGEKTPKGEAGPKGSEAVEAKGDENKDTGEDTMKILLEEANRMIQSMDSDVRQNKAATGKKSSPLDDLQKQLDVLKKASLRPFRLSKIGTSTTRGLIDSGATHPLREKKKGERIEHLPKVSVTLAGDREALMSLTPTGTILGEPGTEPIVPMGKLTTVLNCSLAWTAQGLMIEHPELGKLEVELVDGCPMVSKETALALIDEMERTYAARLRALCVNEEDPEQEFLRKIVDQHPAFEGLPKDVKEALIERPASNVHGLGNRRTRRLWKKQGLVVHAFSGSSEGYTLRRAFHEVGGDRRLLYEFDILHGKEDADLSKDGKAYQQLLRLALDGRVKGWFGGPPCRTRSVLRHQQVEGVELPRPLRSWHGGEHGSPGLSQKEKNQVFEDDVLFMRFILLYVVSEMVRKIRSEEEETALLIEQPAEPANEEVVSWWRTSQWKALKRMHGLSTQTFNQSEFGAQATKPTSVGGNVRVKVPMVGRKGIPRNTEGKTAAQICEESRLLARWPPALMRAIAEEIQVKIFQKPIKIRAISWEDHVRMGHTPFRKDCKTCQMASARDFTHRRSKLPAKVGVLSVDTTGPFREAPDLNYANSGTPRKAKYLIVGAFTWFKPKSEKEEDSKELEIPEGAPVIEEVEDEEQRLKALVDERIQREEGTRLEEAEQIEQREEPDGDEEQLDGEVERREEEDFEVGVTRMCTPVPSRDKHTVLRAIIDFCVRLKADGYQVSQVHSDRGGEYTSDVLADWCAKRGILHTFTPGDSAQTNGRAEVAVQQVKSEIRRTLLGSEADFDRWPLAARFVNEMHRLKQIGKSVQHPAFLEKVLVRKRYWHSKELTPTQEVAIYLGPSWINHGHWIEKENGFQTLTRMAMKGLREAPQESHWIALQDDTTPMEDRRRLRGKVASAFQFKVDGGEILEEEGEEETISPSWTQVQKVIEMEMGYVIDDHDEVVAAVYDAVAQLREIQVKNEDEGALLQTKIVSQAEIRKNLTAWIPAISAELDSMFTKKQALVKIDAEKAKELIKNEEAECLPSKMVYTLKPADGIPGGKKKARLVVCGNYSEEESTQAELFASGATAVALRAGMTIAAQKGWIGKTTDIRTAFLNAPLQPEGVEGETQEEERVPVKRALLRPPQLLIQAGLARPEEFWEAEKAVYGYRKSPKLWGDYRDKVLHKLKISVKEGYITLQQMISEPNMWRLCYHSEGEEEGEGNLVGLLLVYVDDLLVLSDEEVADATLSEIQRHWDLSTPETINKEVGTRFLGSELWILENGDWMATQKSYTVDLLQRNLGKNMEEWKTKRLPLIKEPEGPPDGPIEKDQVREAQRIVGELVWLSTKSRPDLMFVVAKLASLISRDPGQVIQLSTQVWQYLAGTLDYGLIFKKEEECRELGVYTDSSFGDVCHGCVLVKWGQSLLLWKSSRQPVITVSTAESELVEIMDGACAGDAIRVIMEEALDVKARPTSFTDSSSALSIVAGESGSWRTRHLRKRASALRSRVMTGDWMVRHLAGAVMPADIGTKVLSVERFNTLRNLLGMDHLPPEPVKKESGDCRGGQKSEVMKKALQAIVLAAKITQAKGQDELVPWGRPMPHAYISIEIVLLILLAIVLGVMSIGVWIGIYLSNRAAEKTIERIQLMSRPAFLQEESSATQVTAPLPGEETMRLRPSRLSSGPTRGAAGAAASSSGDAAAASSSSAGAAAGSSSAGAAAGSSSAAAEPAAEPGPNDMPIEGERLQIPPPQARRRRQGVQTRTFFISENGERFHNWRTCQGLRKARVVYEIQMCQVCVEPDYQIDGEMYTTGRDDDLHASWAHSRAFSNDPYRNVTPCRICMR